MTSVGLDLSPIFGRAGRRAMAALSVTLLALILLPAASSASGPRLLPGTLTEFRAERHFGPLPAVRDDELANAPRTATITVTFHGFSTAAKTAFQAGVNIWKTRVTSNQVIHIDAHWVPLGANVLGSAGPTSLWIGPDNKLYGVALAEARCHCNLNGSAKEIVANFNSAFPDWDFGTDNSVPNDKWHLKSTVGHEIGHGLGFFSTMQVSGANGSWGLGGTHKDRFDNNEWNQSSGGLKLAKPANYPNHSPALKAQLIDGTVYFGGAHAVAANGGNRVKLYSPNPWQPGSSNSHLDDATFNGTSNAMMTHALFNGESTPTPGAVTMGIFEDIGW